MKKPRFSKASLIQNLETKIKALRDEHHFVKTMGWDQVKDETADVVTEYGRFEAYCDLIDELNGDTPWRD
jgi:hypothetical protein